jgi:putative transport protein
LSLGALHHLLATSTPALLFTVVGLGYFLGSIKIRGFTLGVSAVLFVGLAFGALDPQAFVVPEVIYVLGLILFVYTVGLQSGSVFFNLFRRQWLKLTALTVAAVAGAAVVTVVAAQLLGIGATVASGLFCGGLTNTPALAAAVEALRGSLAGSSLDPAELRPLLDGPTVGYSIAYPFGVVGLILAMQLTTRLRRVDFAAERRRGGADGGVSGEEPQLREIRVTNRQLIGRSFGDAMLTELTGMVFTRIKRGTEVELATPDSVLAEGDVLVGVGTGASIRKAELLIGPTVGEAMDRFSPDLGHRDLLVINRKVAGSTVAELGAEAGCAVVVSRIRRGGVHITPLPQATLELGDQVRVVAHRADLDRLTRLVGDPLKDISEADFLSFSLGLVLGVVVGLIPIPLGGGHVVRLGFAGGPLVVGLVLGRLGRSGPIVWTLPVNASMTLRQLGLLFFLAGVGTLAGGSFVHTVAHQGPTLLLAGALITIVSMVAALALSLRVFRYDAITAYGIVAGIHTQPAALAFANAHTGSERTNVSYAAVYPVALIAKIVLAQILVLL